MIDNKDAEKRKPFIEAELDLLAQNVDCLDALLKNLAGRLIPITTEQQITDLKNEEDGLPKGYPHIASLLAGNNRQLTLLNTFINELIERIEV